jgi:heterodisulfide reductase subunit D
MRYLARLVYYDHHPIDTDLAQIYYRCTSCGICNENCLARPMDIFLTSMREEIVKVGLEPEPVNKANNNIAVVHNPFGSKEEAPSRWAEGLNLPKRAKTIYFAGCYASYRQPEIAKSTVAILRSTGEEIGYLGEDEWCCGNYAKWSGNMKIADEMVVHNIEAIKASGAKKVIFSCDEGYRAFKKDYSQKEDLPFEITHLTEYLAKLVEQKKIKFKRGDAEIVTYHDSCFLGRHMGIYEAPRKVLSVMGVKLNEMIYNRRWSICCGSGAGVVSTVDADYASWSAKNRLLHAKEVAKTLLTTCPRCVENFSKTNRKEKIGLKILSFPEFVRDNLTVKK